MLSIKSECLDRMIILGERHLRFFIDGQVEHYHPERNHHGLSNRLIVDPGFSSMDDGPVICRKRLGRLLNYHLRAA